MSDLIYCSWLVKRANRDNVKVMSTVFGRVLCAMRAQGATEDSIRLVGEADEWMCGDDEDGEYVMVPCTSLTFEGRLA